MTILDTWNPHEIIREVFTWGTYGKHGLEPKHDVLLKDMTIDHIKAILKTQTHIPNNIRSNFENELTWRKNNESKKVS